MYLAQHGVPAANKTCAFLHTYNRLLKQSSHLAPRQSLCTRNGLKCGRRNGVNDSIYLPLVSFFLVMKFLLECKVAKKYKCAENLVLYSLPAEVLSARIVDTFSVI